MENHFCTSHFDVYQKTNTKSGVECPKTDACKHLGLQLQQSKQHVYQPDEYNFDSIDISEVVQDFAGGGGCIYVQVGQ